MKLDEITNEFKLMKQSYLQQDNTLKELTNEVNSLKSTSLDIQNTFSTLQVGLASLLSWKQSKDKFDTQLESTVKQNKGNILRKSIFVH